MYSREEKVRAVELFIKYDLSPASVIRELGYPCCATLYAWHEEYLANGCGMPSANNYRRRTEGQRRTAVDRLFEHGYGVATLFGTLFSETEARLPELDGGHAP